MPVQQYNTMAGAGRPTPQQPSIGCGLPGLYGGNVYGKARLPISVYRRMSPPASKKSPRLTAPVPSDDGSRKPARPYVRKDKLLIRNMRSQRHVESRRWWISRYSLQEIILSRYIFIFRNRGDEIYDGNKVIDRRLETEHTRLYHTEHW